MNMTSSLQTASRDGFFESDLSPFVADFIDYLKRRSICKDYSQRYISDIKYFVQWVNQSHMDVKQLDEAAVHQFLDEHLPHCGLPTSCLS